VALRPTDNPQNRASDPQSAVEADLEIISVMVQGATKKLKLSDGQVIDVHRFAIAGRGDVVRGDRRGWFVELKNGTSRVTPAFRRRDQLNLGAESMPITIKEITTDRELVGYKELADFHYRGELGFGRRAVLVAVANSPELPTVLGFIEITTGFLMSRPRTRILNAPYGLANPRGPPADRLACMF